MEHDGLSGPNFLLGHETCGVKNLINCEWWFREDGLNHHLHEKKKRRKKERRNEKREERRREGERKYTVSTKYVPFHHPKINDFLKGWWPLSGDSIEKYFTSFLKISK